MNEPSQGETMNNLPESNIQPRSKFSIVWLVPMVAILIGAWIGYKAWSETGPTITITFKTADGLEAGKTKIKYKNVEIGEVTAIHVNHDTMNVEVTAEMKRDIKPFLTDKTNFWVVRARIDASGVSGLGTLLSGAYIGLELNSEGKSVRNFTGLEIPPVITGKVPGKHFVLHTKDLGSIERDVPVYYRKFSVGKVEDVKLDPDGESVTVRIFINAPYDQWVNKTTKFWNASGVDVSLNANGIDVRTESLVSLLIGGVAFESKDMSSNMIQAENNSEFKLYKDYADSLKIIYNDTGKYVINFTESVRGLKVGAPVEFRGIQLGEVKEISLSYDIEHKKITVQVTITIDYQRFSLKGNDETAQQLFDTRRERTEIFIKQGIRAQLETGSLLTGQLFVGLDFFPDAPLFVINWDAEIPEFPAVSGTFGAMKVHLGSILKKVDDMMTQIKELSYKLNHNLEPELSGTLKQAENTLVTIQDTLKNDSPLQQDLQMALREFTKAARSIKTLTDYLERHPESLIQGK
ncbi:paraquat-inducible protein B [Bathymodiolus platifrons methanotrophic gill symbiont]|uniref:PqiB family protein n=1 Tax=Bathymodiolus platifrons methanotrophic gill symbiont TaxID=113268 RepID=UPI000B4185D4|nr:MlaD family protein [Bathymodiolus platifrons methanotrophic gill symbiont]GAW86795.1 paraquat-inducible protein B [Bathymodiolus platifrons methanotrophic gill symbiont]GFO73952.1 paraquat-inducible protein B [Bathymodiolus platifrons methanotrophic gill symbiont]